MEYIKILFCCFIFHVQAIQCAQLNKSSVQKRLQMQTPIRGPMNIVPVSFKQPYDNTQRVTAGLLALFVANLVSYPIIYRLLG